MSIATTEPVPRSRGFAGRAWGGLGALPAGMLAGGACGALVGGLLGRVYMRILFLMDESKKGVETDFGTAGQITLGGSFSLLMLSTVAGVIGGMIYVGLRRWLPDRPGLRAGFFGLLMAWGVGFIAVSEIDMRIFEPAVPIYLGFIVLLALYGAAVSWMTDRLHPMRPVRPGPRMERATRGLIALAGLGVCVMAVLATQNVYANAGTCLSGDGKGGCGAPAPE